MTFQYWRRNDVIFLLRYNKQRYVIGRANKGMCLGDKMAVERMRKLCVPLSFDPISLGK